MHAHVLVKQLGIILWSFIQNNQILNFVPNNWINCLNARIRRLSSIPSAFLETGQAAHRPHRCWGRGSPLPSSRNLLWRDFTLSWLGQGSVSDNSWLLDLSLQVYAFKKLGSPEACARNGLQFELEFQFLLNQPQRYQLEITQLEARVKIYFGNAIQLV